MLKISARLHLAKIHLCIMIGFSALFGSILAKPNIDSHSLAVVLGIFFVAAGSATLNSLQEHQIDKSMVRTSGRPLPKGTLTSAHAGLQSVALFVVGLLIVMAAGNSYPAVAMVVLAVFFYNGVYTPLKKKTVYAIVPGAVCGAMPTYIGFVSGGGRVVFFSCNFIVCFDGVMADPSFYSYPFNP